MSKTDSSIHHQWLNEQEQEPKSYALSGKIMLASIIILFVVVVFLVILHLYARWYIDRFHRRNSTRRRTRRHRSNRIVFYVDNNTAPPPPTGGLDAALLKSLPLFVFSDGNCNHPECAVCLSEFVNGETGRVLPKCKHSFHTECIDMWFHSHSTCPLCRAPVEPVEPETSQMTILVEPGSSVLPVQDETTSSDDGLKRVDIRIDVPTRPESVSDNELFRLPSPGFRSPGSRLLSLKKIISMSRKPPAVSPTSGVGPSCLPVAGELDTESVRQESAPDSTRLQTAVDFR